MAIKTIEERMAEKGWATTDSMEYSDGFILAHNWLVIRSDTLDGIFLNDNHGKIAVQKAKERKKKRNDTKQYRSEFHNKPEREGEELGGDWD